MMFVVAMVWAVAAGVASAVAGEQADWGKVVAVGSASDGGMLLIENDKGVHAVVVDPYGMVRTNARKKATLASVKPGDHVDFAVSGWAGMQILDLVVVTPRSPEKLAHVR
jgi:hypothetical protein